MRCKVKNQIEIIEDVGAGSKFFEYRGGCTCLRDEGLGNKAGG